MHKYNNNAIDIICQVHSYSNKNKANCILFSMVKYMCELRQDIIDAVHNYKMLILFVSAFIVGVVLGIASVDSSVVIVDTASGQYIVLLVSSGSVLTVFLRLTVDALLLVLLLCLLSIGHVANYFKILLVVYLGYNTGVCIHTIVLMCGVLTTFVLILVYTLYMLVLAGAVMLSYYDCTQLYGCRGGIVWRQAIENNIYSILVVILAILAMILLNLIIIRPLCSVI